jgi:alpha-tubulin suppressor-like RCC1 family protein
MKTGPALPRHAAQLALHPAPGRGVLLGAVLLLASGCSIDSRDFDDSTGTESLFGMGGTVTNAAAAGAGGSGAAAMPGSGEGLGGIGPLDPGAAPASGEGPGSAPPLVLLDNGAECISPDRCLSGSCEVTALDGASVCCSADCAADTRCSADGLRCEPAARLQGQSCAVDLACAVGLSCMPAAASQSVCCASACNAGEFCIEAGARCQAPLLQDGVACSESGACISGYCDLAAQVCVANPCEGASVGSYCGRGAQCDASGQCTFTAMGLVSAGPALTCTILTAGSVRCWGDNADGGVGAVLDNPAVGDSLDEVPSQVPGLEVVFGTRRAMQVAAGDGHGCALLDDGNVRCWGRNLEGQLVPARADGDVFLPTGDRAVQIESGGSHTCALLASGRVTCWGFNASGQLGLGHNLPLSNVELPTVALAARASFVAAGSSTTCAILEGGALSCWGNGQFGGLGYGEGGDRFAPLGNVDVGGAVTYVATGGRATCAVITGGFVRCWGQNQDGRLGYGHAQDIGLLETPAAAASLTVADDPDGRVLGGDVQLGGGGVEQVEINTDSGHVCARFVGGSVRCWGDNSGGSLGYGHVEDIGDDETPAQAARLAPVVLGGDVPFGRGTLALASGGRCAVLNDRSLICWGRNSVGQLGIPALFPDGTPDLTPAEVLAALGPVQVE